MLTWLASALVAVAAVDTTPPRPITDLVHTTWTVKNGAPTEIRVLAQTADGYLWLGTQTGLYRFDGMRFVPFTNVPYADSSGPRSGGVLSLLGTRDGSLWIVWGNGSVSRYRDARLTRYDELPVTFVLAESRTGTLVAGTAKGVWRFLGSRWEDENQAWGYPAKEARTVWFDKTDALWAQTEDRVVYRPASGPTFLDPGMRLHEGAALAGFAESRDGTVWFAELDRSVHSVPRVGDRQRMTEVQVGSWNVLVDRKGSMWIGSAGDGLRRVPDPSRIRGKSVAQFGPEAEQYGEKDGLLSDVVMAMLEDREGNVWVASPRGLERFREGAFITRRTPGGIRQKNVYVTQDSSLWVLEYARYTVTRINPGDTTTVAFPNLPMSLFEDQSGVVWIALRDQVVRSRRGRFAPVTRPQRGGKLQDITVDRAGTGWLLDGDRGLLRIDGDSLVPVAAISDPSFRDGELFGDRRGRIWIAQIRRVILYDHGMVKEFDRSNDPHLMDFFEDRTGTLWAFGYGGLSRVDDGVFRTLRPHQSLPGRSILGVAQDDAGAWWLATGTNILRVPAGDIDRAMADTTYVPRYRLFDDLDGLPAPPSVITFGPRVARSAEGWIWIATDAGVAGVDPRHLPPLDPPTALIEAVHVDGRELLPAPGFEVAPTDRSLEIDYTAPTLSLPERVQFRYRLEGEDESWQDVGTRRRAYYTGLSPGKYRFRVAARSGEGPWNTTEAAWSFRIVPAWYQTVWFKGAVVLLIGGVGALAAVLIQRRRHRHAQEALRERYEATITERARIAQDLHDTLLQGFAGVTLQLKAAELALPEQPDVAAETILRVQRLARESLREARGRVWDMHESALGDDDLPTALEACARERADGTGIKVSIESSGAPRPLPRPLEDAAFRVGREAVANAVRHAHANRIEILLEFAEDALRLEVRDDGRGFTVDQAEDARRKGHFGLSGIRDRAAHAGGRCEVRSSEGGGTTVALELPLENHRES